MNKSLVPPNWTALKLDDGLPAPNWSPTGECGYWVWRDEKWSWLTDEEYKALKERENSL